MQGSEPGTAHFLLCLCKPQAGPSGNRVVARCQEGVRGGLDGSANWGEMRGAESERGSEPWTHTCLPPSFGTSVPKDPLAEAPFLLGRDKPAAAAEGQSRGARCEGRGGRTLRAFRGGGEGAEPRSERAVAIYPTTPSSSPLKTSDLASRTQGDWPRDREETPKVSRCGVRMDGVRLRGPT